MTPKPEAPNLTRVAREELARYFRHLAARVEKAATAVPEDLLWVKPFSFGNSIGHLVLHLTGNLNHYVGALVAGTGYVRDREYEFVAPVAYPRRELLARFHETVDMVVRTIESQDEAGFATTVEAQEPIRTRLGLFLVCAAHLNNHIGQMSYLVQALESTTNEPPVW
ncbi:MAG: DinB family protein [Isosphaeraceae bacterium]